MVTFETVLDPDNWTEVLQGARYIAFDIVAAAEIQIYFTEGTGDPGNVTGNTVASWPRSWDYQGVGFTENQEIWVRGNTRIRGVRE